MNSDAIVRNQAETDPSATEVVDPVCGMTIDPADAVGTHAHRGTTYYFCNPSCLEQFRADPERFLDANRRGGNPAEAGSCVGGADAEYTCPMDPEVRRIGPGACPKCGMALEPVAFSMDTEETNPEYSAMKRRFLLSLPP